MAGLIPAVELTFQVQLVGAGCPLTVDPAVIQMVDAIVIMGIGKVIQRLTFSQNASLRIAVKLHAVVNIPGKVLQLGVQFQNTIHM